MRLEIGSGSSSKQPNLSAQTRRSYTRFTTNTQRAIIALFQADQDPEIRRLFPLAAEAIQKESAAPVKWRISPPQSILKEIVTAEATMPRAYFEHFSSCLKGEMDLPGDVDLFLQKRQCLRTQAPASLQELLSRLIAPLPKPPLIPKTRPRTWFRLVDSPNAVIALCSTEKSLNPASFETTEMTKDLHKPTEPPDDHPSSIVEVAKKSDVEMLETGEIAPVLDITQSVETERHLTLQLLSPKRINEKSPPASEPNLTIDDVVIEHDEALLPSDINPKPSGVDDPIHDDFTSSSEADHIQNNPSSDEPDLDLRLDQLSPKSAQGQSKGASSKANAADDEDSVELSDSDFSLILNNEPEFDGALTLLAKSSVPKSSEIASATLTTLLQPNAKEDNVSIQDIAREIRKERRSSTGNEVNVGSFSDFSRAFAVVTNPSKSKLKRAPKSKLRSASAKRLKPSFKRPAQRLNTPCQFWVEMRCVKGDECPFSHDVAQVRRTEICRYFMMGSCLKGEDCSHSHSVPCKFFHLQQGGCRETGCRFSHDAMTEDELALFRTRVEEGYYLKAPAPPESTDKDEANDANIENPFST